jgi:hypothetical protein
VIRVLLIFSLTFLMACNQPQPDYQRDIGYIDPVTALGDKSFKPCYEDFILQYYNTAPAKGFKSGKKELRKYVFDQFKIIPGNKDSGYLTFRFVVNCKGQAGRYEIFENDLDYHLTRFDPKLKDHLFKITQELKEWAPIFVENEPHDYYMYLTYRFKNGELLEILP